MRGVRLRHSPVARAEKTAEQNFSPNPPETARSITDLAASDAIDSIEETSVGLFNLKRATHSFVR